MSSRRLAALECTRIQVDPEDLGDFVFVICFMEERWLKKRDEDWIVSVLDEKNEEKKKEIVQEYTSSCGFYRSEDDSNRIVMDRILAEALNIKYSHNKDAQSLTSSQFVSDMKKKEEMERAATNPLNHINCSQPEVATAIKQLSSVLGVASHPDPEISLKAACLYIENELNERVLGLMKEETLDYSTLDLKTSFPLGIAHNKDGAVNIAARILRLLSLQGLKENQQIVNATLIFCQNVIADMIKEQKKNR